MPIRKRVRAWLLSREEIRDSLLSREERQFLAWAIENRELLQTAAWGARRERRNAEIRTQREFVEALERADLDDWDSADSRVRRYFGPRPNEYFLRNSIKREKRELERLETRFREWTDASTLDLDL